MLSATVGSPICSADEQWASAIFGQFRLEDGKIAIERIDKRRERGIEGLSAHIEAIGREFMGELCVHFVMEEKIG